METSVQILKSNRPYIGGIPFISKTESEKIVKLYGSSCILPDLQVIGDKYIGKGAYGEVWKCTNKKTREGRS